MNIDSPVLPPPASDAPSEPNPILGPFSGLTRQFDVAFRPHPDSEDLVVVFAPSPTLTMVRRPFDQNVLHLADKRQSYYVLSAWHLALALVEATAPFRRVLFIGGSKGGFGSLLIAALCAKRVPERRWHVLAFSPQTDLRPGSTAAFYPSVRNLWRRTKNSPRGQKSIELHGDAALIRNLPNAHATIVYPITNLIDSEAATRLSAANVRLYPLHFPIHNTLLPFMWKNRPVQRVIDGLERVYGEKDADVNATRPSDFAAVAQDITNMRWLPTLEELVAETIA